MLLELMSNGSLAELPPENVKNLPESSVMLLLPHNKYLLGTADKWIYASNDPTVQAQDIFLQDNQVLSLSNDGANPTIIPAVTVNALKRELFSLIEPPGRYFSTVSMLRTFAAFRNHPVFLNSVSEIPLEEDFNAAMKEDLILSKAYWALRFGLAHNELEVVRRLKAWLKADPKIFQDKKNVMKIWFTLLEMPDKNVIKELTELSFSPLEIKRMSEQHLSPLILYNPISGWLILARFGKIDTMFISWIYLNHDLYHELRENKKLSVNDIVHAVWGEYETQQTMQERSKYKGAD